MADSYSKCYIHYVFSTKGRINSLFDAMRPDLFSYMGGIAKNYDMIPVQIGGVDDHIHALVVLPTVLSIAEGVKNLKGGSTNWVRESYDQLADFSWQKGYGAFSVSQSNLPDVKQYIANQKKHHKKMGFREEYKQLLDSHGIDYNEEYMFG